MEKMEKFVRARCEELSRAYLGHPPVSDALVQRLEDVLVREGADPCPRGNRGDFLTRKGASIPTHASDVWPTCWSIGFRLGPSRASFEDRIVVFRDSEEVN